MRLKDYLKNNRIITDGAMGTYYDKISGQCTLSEDANIEEADTIKNIHKEYIKAGARFIRTNTYAINTKNYEDKEQMAVLIEAAVNNARQAVAECVNEGIIANEEEVYIAADMGPVIDAMWEKDGDSFEIYKYLVDSFLKHNLNVFVFETLSEWSFLGKISEYIKSATDAYVLAQFSFDRSGYTKNGLGLASMLKEVGKLQYVDGYGINCGLSSSHMYNFLKDETFAKNKDVSALPNSGYPNVIRGKVVYSVNNTYFSDMMDKIDDLGVRILGGCCGTTPEHIRAIADRLSQKAVSEKKSLVYEEDSQNAGTDSDNYIINCINNGKKVIMVELDPPFDGNVDKVIEGARYLKGKGTDIITLSDSPMARARMDAGLLSAKVIKETGMRVMPHIACRDRNKIALRGLIMGMHANAIRNLLIVTGDPIIQGDNVKSVYEFNSIKLMEYIKNINQEVFPNDNMFYGGALNYHGVNPDAIALRMTKKMQAGAKYFLTQPVYSDSDIERLAYLKDKTDAKLIVGIMPLISYKNAMFIKNEMAGINVPDSVIDRYKEGLSREEYENIAVDISNEIIRKLKNIADGYYFMTPFNRYALIQKIIDDSNF